MLTVSGRWAATVAANHMPITRFQVWRTGTLLIPSLPVKNGSLTKDASTFPRITATIDVADTRNATAELLTPFGSRIRIFRGVSYPDNTIELPLIADLDIVKATFARPAGTLTLELADPAGAVSADGLAGPRAYGGNTVRDTIQALLADASYYGSKDLTDQTTTAAGVLTAPDYTVDGDRWDAIEQLADQAAAECFFTPARAPVLRPEPTVKATADATLYAGDGGVVTAMSSELVRAPNMVALYGGPDPVTGKQIRGVAWDSNASSPSYALGPYGRVVLVEQRPAPFANAAAATSAAASFLGRVQTGVRAVEIECVPNPALEPGDTVEIRFVNGAKERHLVRSLEIPLGPADTMRLRCSTTTYTTAGWP
jgi:hypothetical protein